jgi:hypothetical protein
VAGEPVAEHCHQNDRMQFPMRLTRQVAGAAKSFGSSPSLKVAALAIQAPRLLPAQLSWHADHCAIGIIHCGHSLHASASNQHASGDCHTPYVTGTAPANAKFVHRHSCTTKPNFLASMWHH